jgi:hypothetical protein
MEKNGFIFQSTQFLKYPKQLSEEFEAEGRISAAEHYATKPINVKALNFINLANKDNFDKMVSFLR